MSCIEKIANAFIVQDADFLVENTRSQKLIFAIAVVASIILIGAVFMTFVTVSNTAYVALGSFLIIASLIAIVLCLVVFAMYVAHTAKKRIDNEELVDQKMEVLNGLSIHEPQSEQQDDDMGSLEHLHLDKIFKLDTDVVTHTELN